MPSVVTRLPSSDLTTGVRRPRGGRPPVPAEWLTSRTCHESSRTASGRAPLPPRRPRPLPPSKRKIAVDDANAKVHDGSFGESLDVRSNIDSSMPSKSLCYLLRPNRLSSFQTHSHTVPGILAGATPTFHVVLQRFQKLIMSMNR